MSSYRLRLVITTLSFPLALGVAGCSSSSSDSGAAQSCAEAASDGVRECVGLVNAAWASCYADGNAPCSADDENIAQALAQLGEDLERSCDDGEFLSLSTEALVGRLQNSCKSEADSIAWRTYGGPQGAVYPDASGGQKSCLSSAHGAALGFMDRSLAAINECLTGESCDEAAVEAERASFVDETTTEVEEACGDVALADVIAVNPAQYVDRLEEQVDCITATAHADTGELSLRCGPSNTDFDAPARGEWTRITVDGDKWGTVCGDGSAYSFWVKLAPGDQPLDRVVVGLQGGGVCVLEPQCADRIENNPGLFTAADDEPYSTGLMNNDPEVSPFANWTHIWLPYCNQDVFAGGGIIEYPGTVDLPRYGAINLRSAVRMVRDVIWKEMDAAEGPGFRPDELISIVGGWSAGGYGVLYNYNWFLDELLWPRTAAFPDAGGALDNEQPFGVALLGAVNIPEDGWNMQPFLPSYCFEGDCAVGPFLYRALSPRLKQVPEQQMLILSNPYDDTQRRDAFFTGMGTEEDEWQSIWMNTMRQDYCDTSVLPGINYYYTSVTEQSTHTVSLNPTLWEGSVDGEVMRDWMWRAVTEPDTIESRVEEGDFVETFPGVEPYPCEVAP